MSITQQGILVTHCGAQSISRAELQTIDVPPATATWKPIKHADLVDCIEQGLQARGVTVGAEQFAVQRDGKVFSVCSTSVCVSMTFAPR